MESFGIFLCKSNKELLTNYRY